MRKLILTALLALAVPAGALAADQAPSPDDCAKAACKSEKAKMGTKTFTATYAASGASRATEACVAKRDGRAATDLKNAAKACKAERAAEAVVGGGGGWSPRAQSTRSASASWPAAARRRPPRGRTARTGGRYMESSPGTWCKSLALTSSVMPLVVQAAMSSTSLSLLSREVSFSAPGSLRVAIDFWLM